MLRELIVEYGRKMSAAGLSTGTSAISAAPRSAAAAVDGSIADETPYGRTHCF